MKALAEDASKRLHTQEQDARRIVSMSMHPPTSDEAKALLTRIRNKLYHGESIFPLDN